MKLFISYLTVHLLLLFGCQAEQKSTLVLPSGRIIKVKILETIAEQEKGLSGVREDQLGDYEGYFFKYDRTDIKQFWMPDTYFNLNIIFLDADLKVLYIEENIPAHPGRQGQIPRTRAVRSRHVLEIKSSSPLAQEIAVGTQFKWM